LTQMHISAQRCLFIKNHNIISHIMPNQGNLVQQFAIAKNKVKLPLIIWLVFIGTVMAFSGEQVFGFNMRGLGWFFPFCAAMFFLITRINRVKFPFFLWMPWILVLIGYYFYSDFPALQRSVQILCPIAIAMAVSSYRYQEEHIDRFLQLITYLSIILIVLIIFRLGLPFTGVLPGVTGLSAEAISAILFSTIYATKYSFGNKNDIKWWWLMAAVPVIAVTRTAIAMSGLTLPFTWGPMKLSRRILLVIIIIILGFVLFHTPRLQKKTFKSGEGEMSDILSKDFSDNARFFMWEKFDEQIKKKPWFGYGAGAGERFVRLITNNVSGYPHNDWRLTLYDYGIFGTSIYVLCIVFAMFHAYRKSKRSIGKGRLLFLAGASSFIPFMLIMYTDNIMVYVSFFGNLQFTLLGIAYGMQSTIETSPQKQIKVRW
jgi:O-antigen ligase